MTGRPSSFTPEIAAEICLRLAEGESLREICSDEGMPARSTVGLWVVNNVGGFSAQYARAREAQGIANADRAIQEALTASDPQLGRLRYDALRWHASKMAPKVYGDRVTQEHTGEGGGPVRYRVEIIDADADPATEGQEAASAAGPAEDQV